MKVNVLFFLGIFLFFTACNNKCKITENNEVIMISKTTIDKVVNQLKPDLNEANFFRLEKGVTQVALFWKNEDGTEEDFERFCIENFVTEEDAVEQLFDKTSYYFEILYGNFNKMNIELKKVLHLDLGEVTPIDLMFGAYNPASHLTDDLFNNKIAHTILLNFPHYTLKEKEELGKNWNRRQWAYARMGDAFNSRTPAKILLKEAEISTQADNYIAQYNIVMNKLLDENNEVLYDKELKLISHWGLRDELKSNYGSGELGLRKQKLIYEVMTKIVKQEIPEIVINNDNVTWNPFANKVLQDGKELSYYAEPYTRYKHLLNNFKVLKEIDAYSPYYPTYIDRAFEKDMELTQTFVEELFIELVSSDQAKMVGTFISKRLGRELQPFDIWYDGFKSRSSLNEDDLTKVLMKKYPHVKAYQDDMANILVKLGYQTQKANEIASKIIVEGARGAGHAWGSQMKSEKAFLRTRMAKDGMDYKGYNIAMHELGHNVEQTITLQDVDYYMLRGVPNTAFTEAMAFMFQTRDLKLMGINNADPNAIDFHTLDIFWGVYEIMGVSLVDMNVWKWLYANPNATEEELAKQVINISIDIWNKYYAPVFGVKDSPILGIYSHMIAYPLYLSAYPIGHLIEFQIEDYIKNKKANFAEETYRMFVKGSVVPQIWMVNAVGEELSNKPMLKAVDMALINLNQ